MIIFSFDMIDGKKRLILNQKFEVKRDTRDIIIYFAICTSWHVSKVRDDKIGSPDIKQPKDRENRSKYITEIESILT